MFQEGEFIVRIKQYIYNKSAQQVNILYNNKGMCN